jgi:hypothetical protein
VSKVEIRHFIDVDSCVFVVFRMDDINEYLEQSGSSAMNFDSSKPRLIAPLDVSYVNYMSAWDSSKFDN